MSDPVRDLKQELLAAAERRHPHTAGRTGLNRVLLVAAALSIAAAVSLIFTAPWKSSPGFLEKAQAALTPPAGTVLHYGWVETRTSKDFGCTVTEGLSEIWIDQTPPFRYRTITSSPGPQEGPLPARTLACGDYRAIEFGGSQDEYPPLMFVPPNTLRVAYGVYPGDFSRDPIAGLSEMIREALDNGRAHHEGKTELDGRVVERIRLDHSCPPPHLPCGPPRPSFLYLDPDTYLPVQVVSPGGYAITPGGGLGDRTFFLDTVARYLTIEYLPRTAANLALTDIRAQHPDATGP